MKKPDHTSQGSVHISPRAIATIAYQAAIESYGVVGLASKNLFNGLTHLIVKDPTHGVEVHYEDEAIIIDIYIVVEYGTNIKTVADSVANTIRFHVEKALGLPIREVNVRVQGLRVSGQELP
ncbi:MAG: Asp23/Gls24 family envelope stress response protein [Anaerolineales bacterium]